MGLLGDLVDAGGDLAEGAVEFGEGIYEAASEIADEVDDLFEEAGRLLEQAAKDVDGIAEIAIRELDERLSEGWDRASAYVDQVGEAVEGAWESSSAAVEAAWNAASESIENLSDEAEGAVAGAWDNLEESTTKLWDQLCAVAEDAWREAEDASKVVATWAVDAYEFALAVIDRTMEWLGDLADNVADCIVKLGACLAGQVIYRLAKAGNILANLSRPVRWLPSTYVADVGHLYGGTLFSDVWYVDNATLTANWFTEGEPTNGMTFAGVTLAGVNLSYIIFLSDDWSEGEQDKRELMAHELVHVRQYRKLKVEAAFACAYAIGYASADFDYASNPFEAEAFEFVRRNAASIA